MGVNSLPRIVTRQREYTGKSEEFQYCYCYYYSTAETGAGGSDAGESRVALARVAARCVGTGGRRAAVLTVDLRVTLVHVSTTHTHTHTLRTSAANEWVYRRTL